MHQLWLPTGTFWLLLDGGDSAGRQPIAQRELSRLAPSPVGQHAAGDRQQPRQLITGRLVEPAPRGHEHVGDHVIGRAGRHAPVNEGAHRPAVRLIDRLKPSP